MKTTLGMLTSAGLLALAASAVQAGALRPTIEATSIQKSQVTGHALFKRTFDGFTTGVQSLPATSAIGEYGGSDFEIAAESAFGGAGVPASGSPQYATTDDRGYTVSNVSAGGNSGPAGYFGFWWSAGNGNNETIVSMADSSSQTFSTRSIIDSPNLQGARTGNVSDPPDGHDGNPVGTYPAGGYNANEVYAFVNIYALDAGSLTGGPGFSESDNDTISFDLISPGNQSGDNGVPVPATALLLGAGLGLMGWTRRRRRDSAIAAVACRHLERR